MKCPVLLTQHRVLSGETHMRCKMNSDDEKAQGPKWGWARKGAGWSGPPWMRGGPFGPGFRGGGRPGRMFGQGDLKLLLLALIADKPSHGYDLIRSIEAKFDGAYVPSPGTIYPTLTLLEEQDLVTSVTEAGGKKSYSITALGTAFLADNAEQVIALFKRVDIMAGAAPSGPMPETVMHTIQTLRHAIMAKSGTWTAVETDRVRAVLEAAARDIMSGGK
jgi:DNA-binding PadR family transcriptional regulator